MDENRGIDSTEELKKSDSADSASVTARVAWRAKIQATQGINGGGAGAQDQSDGASENAYYHGGAHYYRSAKPQQSTGKKALIIMSSIVGGIILLAILLNLIGFSNDDHYISDAADVGKKHIGVLYIEGTISTDDSVYSHQYVMDSLNGMMENSKNKGLMLYVNTPGGGVYESDEVYLKIKEYQDTTKRPVYVYMASQATSGGYYISAPADKIMANRNCWTGSIGVTMGTLIDISGLLKKYGVKTETITSGDNKAMGSMTDPLTDEQREIMQSMIDEAYEQFVGIVAEGRDMKTDYVKDIADGRIYTALQAKKLDLIDEVVNTYDEAENKMINECGLSDCETYEFRYEADPGLIGSMLQSMDKLVKAYSGKSDINALTELMQQDNKLPLQYMCEVVR